MGVEAPETCWATHKRQVINLWNCCIWLVNLSEMYDDARNCQRQRLFFIYLSLKTTQFTDEVSIASSTGQHIFVPKDSRALASGAVSTGTVTALPTVRNAFTSGVYTRCYQRFKWSPFVTSAIIYQQRRCNILEDVHSRSMANWYIHARAEPNYVSSHSTNCIHNNTISLVLLPSSSK
jgi:hypothetical protein